MKDGNTLFLIKEEDEMTNAQIRNEIEIYVRKNGPQNTRTLISLFAARFSTSKQRIAGNVSCMVCMEQTANIMAGAPNSIIYC